MEVAQEPYPQPGIFITTVPVPPVRAREANKPHRPGGYRYESLTEVNRTVGYRYESLTGVTELPGTGTYPEKYPGYTEIRTLQNTPLIVLI